MKKEELILSKDSVLKGDTVTHWPFIIEQFNRSLELYADRPAVVAFDGTSMTYREFGERVERFASFLLDSGLNAQQVVAVKLRRTPDLLIVVFALFRLRLIYLPIDPSCPSYRQKMIFGQVHPSLLITTDQDPSLGSEIWQLVMSERCFPERVRPIEQHAQLDDLAYIIYTSGSTGCPKGVKINHAALGNRLHWMQKSFPLSKEDVVLHKTPIGFDVSIWELFWWCYAGACVLPFPSGEEHNVHLLYQYTLQRRVSVIHFVPSVLNIFLEYLSASKHRKLLETLRLVFSSGEILRSNTVEEFYNNHAIMQQCELVNLYGPTEATIDVSYYRCPRGLVKDPIPIGLPVDNTTVLVLDRDLKVQPRGVVGQLCIAGVCLADGYVKASMRHFCSLASGIDIYQTGDQAVIQEDGYLYYTGRKDRQIKLRGLRIELCEIEFHLHQLPCIQRSVVTLSRDNHLQAYIKLYAGMHDLVKSSEIKLFLSRRLPYYMLPSRYIRVEAFPLKQNGKLDLNALRLSCQGVDHAF